MVRATNTKADLARLAAAIRTETGTSPSAPFDPWAWSEDNGIPFIAIQQLPNVADAIRHFTDTKPGVWSGALFSDGIGLAVLYDADRGDARLRSDLTHEVAHVAAEHRLATSWGDDSGKCGAGNRTQEKEAAELAGFILVPADQAKLWAMRGWPAESLARQYGVSNEMATWRMRTSGGHIIAARAARRRGA